jgi:hypothetical protein
VPEWTHGGRRSILTVVRLDDGSSRLAFGRTVEGTGGIRSLELLTQGNLDALCERGEVAILYTHWTNRPREVFTARGLDALARLRRYRDEGRVWVAPATEILWFSFVRTFLEFTTRAEAGKTIIDITGVDDPIGPHFVPTREELEGLFFETSVGTAPEVRLAGSAVEPELLETHEEAGRVIVGFPLRDRRRE